METPIVGDLIQAGADLIKTYFPPDMTPEQKAQAEAKLSDMRQAMEAKAQEYKVQQEQERTKRLQADMASDSWLSKNIRPMVLVYLMGAWTIFAGFSFYQHQVDPAYVGMLKDMLTAAFGFYFVSRGIEKMTSIIKGKQ